MGSRTWGRPSLPTPTRPSTDSASTSPPRLLPTSLAGAGLPPTRTSLRSSPTSWPGALSPSPSTPPPGPPTLAVSSLLRPAATRSTTVSVLSDGLASARAPPTTLSGTRGAPPGAWTATSTSPTAPTLAPLPSSPRPPSLTTTPPPPLLVTLVTLVTRLAAPRLVAPLVAPLATLPAVLPAAPPATLPAAPPVATLPAALPVATLPLPNP